MHNAHCQLSSFAFTFIYYIGMVCSMRSDFNASSCFSHQHNSNESICTHLVDAIWSSVKWMTVSVDIEWMLRAHFERISGSEPYNNNEISADSTPLELSMSANVLDRHFTGPMHCIWILDKGIHGKCMHETVENKQRNRRYKKRKSKK